MVTSKEKKRLISKSFNMFKKVLDDEIKFNSMKTKFTNINGKTGSYNVPLNLFQQRTRRNSRVLIEWKAVMNNRLTIDDLSLFEGDVVVAFINNDYFGESDVQFKELFIKLKERLGSDEKVSSMILIKSEDGNPSSKVQREAYEKLVVEFPDYKDHLIRRDPNVKYSGKGNNVFKGFIYYDIRGGQQNMIYSHEGIDSPNLFNPAIEYASTEVCLDIDLTLHYFALKSIPFEKRDTEFDNLIIEFKSKLNQIIHPQISDDEKYDSLYDYCENHPSLKIGDLDTHKQLYDPIQFEKIFIEDFSVKTISEIENLDLSHNTPVNFERFHVDQVNNEILSASRPTNLFWSRHLSNMMQQNSTLSQYFKRQEELVNLRNKYLKIDKKKTDIKKDLRKMIVFLGILFILVSFFLK